MATTFGNRPEDVVADSSGNVLSGVVLQIYPTEADAEAQTAMVGQATSDSTGSWPFTDASSRSLLWVRDPNGRVWPVGSEEALGSIADKADTATVNAALALKARKFQINVVDDHGADPTGVADSTAALVAAAAAVPASGGRIYFPPGTYLVSTLADAATLMSFTGKTNLVIDATEATISNPTSYTADTVTSIFKFDACTNVRVTLGAYVGYTLPTPETHLGYRGCTLVYALNGTDGVKVEAKITNARYGVLTGAYATPAAGECKNFDIRLRTSFCGYPVAAYLAHGLRLDIDADDVHRATYIAGCNDVTGFVRLKNTFVAPIAFLITDALTSGTDAAAQIDPVGAATTSRACTNVQVKVFDKGSTTFVVDTYLAGISLSRVDPMAFKNIDVEVYLTATDTVATTMHGFQINSTANTIWSRYTNNWEPTVLLENVRFKTFIDKSACTVATATGSNGPVTLRTDDPAVPTKFATVRNMVWDDSEVRPGSTGSMIARLYVRGLVTPMVVERLSSHNAAGTPALYVLVAGNTSQPVEFADCSFATLDRSPVAAALVTLRGRTAATAPDVDGTFGAEGGTIRGAGPRRRLKIVTTAALSGANQTLTGAIPAGATDVRVQARVITAITGASGFQLGVSGDLTRYGDRAVTGTGNLLNTEHHAASAFTAVPSGSATDLIVTAKTSNFTAGVLRIAISYDEYPNVAS